MLTLREDFITYSRILELLVCDYFVNILEFYRTDLSNDLSSTEMNNKYRRKMD